MPSHNGRIVVICGSMFSGKTEELIRRIRRAQIARQKVQVFKPKIDTRFVHQSVTSHNGQDFEAVPVEDSQELLCAIRTDTTVVGIDEAQFFDKGLTWVVGILADVGIHVIIAGLNLDFRGEPFGPMAELMVRADEIQSLNAICMVCGEEATRTQRLVNGEAAHYDDPIVVIGASDCYEARCRTHHIVPGKNNS